eukprot:CAMPEP_0180160586 /NCGR_PEP_ID=MMETSP0986-20121125/28199_1 /TAXON_ID=697907 /ORGANISM="non described non described, Strain CCMP2293" /LENGTH=407 /DNA_ID=CAMNT_0022110873 /DNA_START=173 /DNA_END=1397 /DNA_ORIENTATION=+
MLLCDLPADALAAVVSRVDDPATLQNLTAVSMRGSISTIARSDTIWETVFVETWGEAFLNKVSSSIIGDPTGEGAAADTEEEAPGWMREPARLSSAQEEVMQAAQDFVADPDRCAARLCEGTAETELRKRAEIVAAFLFHTSALHSPRGLPNSEQMQGAATKYMSASDRDERAVFSRLVRRAYVAHLTLRGLPVADAIRLLLSRTAMPTEAGRVCRIMWILAGEFFAQNGGSHTPDSDWDSDASSDQDVETDVINGSNGVQTFISHDVVYLLMWSALFLNSDMHNPKIMKKMKRGEWVASTCVAIKGVVQKAASLAGDARITDFQIPPALEAELHIIAESVALKPLLRTANYTYSRRQTLVKWTTLSTHRADTAPFGHIGIFAQRVADVWDEVWNNVGTLVTDGFRS